MSLNVNDWGASKAKRERVEGVVVVVLVLVPGGHGEYSDVPHYHHFHHPHHQRRRWPTIARSPNWEGIERPTATITEDSRDGGFEPHRSKGFGTLDSPPQLEPKGMGEIANTRSGHRYPFDQRLGRSSLGPPCPKFLARSLARLDWWWSCLPRPVPRYRTLAEDVGHHRPCLLFEGPFKGLVGFESNL